MKALNLKLATLVLLAGAAGVASAEGRNGEHPAVIQARLIAKAGYDYASKFYPHPARLELYAEAPRERGHHPAVIVARDAARAVHACARCVEQASSPFKGEDGRGMSLRTAESGSVSQR